MYDLQETRALTDAWWKGLRRHLSEAGVEAPPVELHRPRNLMAHWSSDALCFSQTCGYPLTHALRDQVTLLGTPLYSVPGCSGADYSSAVLVNADTGISTLGELRDGRAVFNGTDSHSGYNALRALIAPLARGARFFSNVSMSGSHAESAAMVGAAGADVCAVDAVSYALLGRYAPARLSGTRLLTWSTPAPGLPYVSRRNTSPFVVAAFCQGIRAAFADPRLAEVRDGLFLGGFKVSSEKDYQRITAQEKTAVALGYPMLV